METTYVSYENVEGVLLPLMVHPNLKDIKSKYGRSKATDTFCSTQVINTPFLQYPRVEKAFTKAFSPIKVESEIKSLFQLASKRGGEDRVYELRKEVDLRFASHGVIVSKTGSFEDNGGIVGVDYMVCPSLRYA